MATIPVTRIAAANFSFQVASVRPVYALLIGPMIVLPVALKIYTAVTTIDAQARIVANRYRVSGFCQEPMNTVISATNPLKPGNPKEHKPAITNMVEIKGITFNSPPNWATILVCVLL